MIPQRTFANSLCMGVVKAMETGSGVRWSARTSATFQVKQVSEVFIVSLSSVLQWALLAVGTRTSVELCK
jgi:hypothetical protein